MKNLKKNTADNKKHFMPDITELKQKLQQMREALEKELPNIATRFVLNVKAVAEQNILTQGFGEHYKETKVPTWFSKGNTLNKKGEKFLSRVDKRKTDKGKASWKEVRDAQGLQTAFVDLHYRGGMFSGMLPTQAEIQEGKVTVYLAGTNQQAQNEMQWNFERYGPFIQRALTEENTKTLADSAIQDMLQVLEPFKL